MSAHGGWSRWLSALVCGGLASAFGSMLLPGCGGRTSTLDPDVYRSPADVGDDDDDGGRSGASGSGSLGGSKGGRGGSSPGSAGKPSVGGMAASGGGPVAVGGAPAAGGAPNVVDPTLAISPCKAYCPGYGTQCAARLMGRDCFTTCQAQVNGSGPRCQMLAIKALQCLTPFFTPNGKNCDEAVARALVQCGQAVSDFETCGGTTTPLPPMPTTVDVTTCPGMGNGDSLGCRQVFACPNGVYDVRCSVPASSSVASCSCSQPSGGAVGSTVANSAQLCSDAARLLCR